MKMLKSGWPPAAVVFLLALQTACTPAIKAEHPEAWPEIENNIRGGWLRYVDTTDVLPHPFSYALNPGTLYYWDLYFINEGLMMQGFWEQARNNVDNFTYEVEKLGFIPNAHGWGEDRSQTPYYGMMVRSYWEKAPEKDTAWLRKAYLAVIKEYEFWTNENGNEIENHRTSIPGLQRYGNHADTAAQVVFYDRVLKGRFHLPDGAPREEKMAIASHRMSECETMDFNPRFEGRCNDYIAVDLNSNLCQYEKDLAYFEQQLGIVSSYGWEDRAERRAEAINAHLWNEERGLYMDYDYVNERFSPIASVITLMPLYRSIAPVDRAARVRKNLSLFDSPGGLVVCEVSEQPVNYQWGDDDVWAPMQFIAMDALHNYGYKRDARRVALQWLNTATRNFLEPVPATYPPFKYGDGNRHPGFLYEKYTRTGEINDGEYSCSEMMGWSAATFLKALQVVK